MKKTLKRIWVFFVVFKVVNIGEKPVSALVNPVRVKDSCSSLKHLSITISSPLSGNNDREPRGPTHYKLEVKKDKSSFHYSREREKSEGGSEEEQKEEAGKGDVRLQLSGRWFVSLRSIIK